MNIYKILLVEDEPPMLRRIKRIIEKKPSSFQVVAEANNGREALDLIANVRPELVIADIKMPLMNGLELSKIINEQYPDIIVVIISGYQDFSYARDALKFGVFDYLLKPVEPELLYKLLDTLAAKLDKKYIEMDTNILKRIINSQPVDREIIYQRFSYEYYCAFIIRSGPLIRRFVDKTSTKQDLQNTALNLPDMKKQYNIEIFWVINGRDDKEILTIFPVQQTSFKTVKTLVHNIAVLKENSHPFTTVVYTEELFTLENLAENIQNLYITLDNNLVFGKHTLTGNNMEAAAKLSPPILGSNLENKLNILIQNKSFNIFKEELTALFHGWENQSLPQIWVEKMVKQIFRLIEKNSPGITSGMSINTDQMLEKVFSVSSNFGELLTGLWRIAESLFYSFTATDSMKNEEISLLEDIEAYINLHIAESITLQQVCELFGVYQPYLSRLFRKYNNVSFNEYVTILRVNEAKRLMKEQPEMLFKNIAEIVGYPDQHYFSRLFKSITGLTPSKFKGEL